MKTNGLTYLTLETTSTTVSVKTDSDILKNAPKNAWFIAYLYHRVVIGRIEDKQFIYYKQEDEGVTLSNVLKLRAFNENSELFVWKTNLDGYRARLREDKPETITIPEMSHSTNWFKQEQKHAVDAKQVLFGTKAEKLISGYWKLTENRGTEIILPSGLPETGHLQINDEKKRLCIKTRSYIGYIEETGQATYEDVRFVKFEMYKEEEQ